LGFQYFRFVSPPTLVVLEPKDGEIVNSKSLDVFGKTDTDAVVSVNNQPTLVKEDGSFNTKIEIFEGTKEIVVKAVSRSGRETVVRRKIIPQLK